MNLILINQSELISNSKRVRISGRRLRHVLEIIKPRPGDDLTVGLEGGLMGKGRVVELSEKLLELDVNLKTPPPAKLPVILCVALMRPIVLKRVLLTAASLGVEEIVLFHSRQVEKSFWQSTALKEEEIRDQLILGLEQARDTVLPKVSQYKKFKPFVEDVLPKLLNDRVGIVAHPEEKEEGRREKEGITFPSVFRLQPSFSPRSFVVLIGPESGFIPYEIEKFQEAGCQVVGLGERILKVETAIVTMLAKIF